MSHRFRWRRHLREMSRCLLDSTGVPLSRFLIAGHFASNGFHRHLPRPRRYNWLSPPGRSVSPPAPVLPEAGDSTPHRMDHISANHPRALRPGLLSLARDKCTPPSEAPKHLVRTAGPAVPVAFAAVCNGPPRTSDGAVPLLGWKPLPDSSLAGSAGAGDSSRFSGRVILPVPGILPELPFGGSGRAFSKRFSDLHRSAERALS
jgi:hypothetical protein